MNVLDPFVTVHDGTGAFRTITSNLLAETYLAPRAAAFDLNSALSTKGQPWSSSMAVAPLETATAVFAALRSVAMATEGLSPDEIDLSDLDRDSRIYRHLAALCDLWRHEPAALSEDLQVYVHVLNCSAVDALEPPAAGRCRSLRLRLAG